MPSLKERMAAFQAATTATSDPGTRSSSSRKPVPKKKPGKLKVTADSATPTKTKKKKGASLKSPSKDSKSPTKNPKSPKKTPKTSKKQVVPSVTNQDDLSPLVSPSSSAKKTKKKKVKVPLEEDDHGEVITSSPTPSPPRRKQQALVTPASDRRKKKSPSSSKRSSPSIRRKSPSSSSPSPPPPPPPLNNKDTPPISPKRLESPKGKRPKVVASSPPRSPAADDSPSKRRHRSKKLPTAMALENDNDDNQKATKSPSRTNKKGSKTAGGEGASSPSRKVRKKNKASAVVTPSPTKNKNKKVSAPTSQPPPKTTPSKIMQGLLKGCLTKLQNPQTQGPILESYLKQMDDCNAFGPLEDAIHKLSERDNDLVQTMTKVMAYDPTITRVVINDDVRLEHVKKSTLCAFARAFACNPFVTHLEMVRGGLGNDFLSYLATALESNVALQTIDLRHNAFTSDGLMEFCQVGLSSANNNNTCTHVHLEGQHSPLFETAYDSVFAVLEENSNLQELTMDFKTTQGQERLDAILQQNQRRATTTSRCSGDADDRFDDKLLALFQEEAIQARAAWEHGRAEAEMGQINDDDWEYLYELSVLYDKFKVKEEQQQQDESANDKPKGPMSRAGVARALSGMIGYTDDGKFLTADFISKYLKENKDNGALTFDFCGQSKLFKRFPTTDKVRPKIMAKFVSALLSHPRAKDITGINMANSGCGNDFFEQISEQCLEDPLSKLPKLHTLNAETNFLTVPGITAIANLIANPNAVRHLQVVRLENQKSLVASKAESALARAMCLNRSVVVCSLRVRGLLERQQINKYVVRNIDFLRQARRHHAIATGTLQERKRNEMEQLFDKIAANDASIKEVNLVGNLKFLSLNKEETIKAGAAFATNTHVETVMMSTLKLDDAFAKVLGESLATNGSIKKLLLDSNSFTGDGLKALFAGLAKNTSISELQVRHQSKVTASSDEEMLPDILEPNKSISKLGIDLRNQFAKMKIDRKINMNREYQRKLRAQAKKAAASSS